MPVSKEEIDTFINLTQSITQASEAILRISAQLEFCQKLYQDISLYHWQTDTVRHYLYDFMTTSLLQQQAFNCHISNDLRMLQKLLGV